MLFEGKSSSLSFPSNMMCSTQLFDSMMDQAPFATEAPQIYTPALNLLHHKILCF